MRHIFPIALLTILTGIFAFSCEEAKEAMKSKMTAKIDGETWESLFRFTALKDSTVVITATNKIAKNEGKQIAITIYGKDEGKYTLSATSATAECTAVYKPDASVDDENQYFLSTEGEVNVSNIDRENKQISGTFEFTMVKDLTGANVEITDGEFNELNYQNLSGK